MNDKKKNNIQVTFVLLLFLLGLVSDLRVSLSIWENWQPANMFVDAYTLWEDRLKLLVDDIPTTGSIGYLSEMDIEGFVFNPIDTNQEYVLTQYYLVPRILIRGKDFDYIIGNFADLELQEPDVLEAALDVEVLASYGNGIYLMRGNQP